MTPLPASVAPPGPQASDDLRGRLPQLSTGQAALLRISQDARYAAWLRATLQQASLGVALRAPFPVWTLTVDSDHGRFRLGLDPSDSPALQLALAHPSPTLACAVVAQLLDEWGQALTPALGPLRLTALSPERLPEAPWPGRLPCIQGGGMPVALLDADAGVLERLATLLHPVGADLSPLATWPVRPVLRLFTRALPLSVLRSLQPGDAVLADASGPLLRCGIGRVLQARLFIDPQEFTVHVAEAPILADDPPGAQPEDGVHGLETPPVVGALETLELPVAFELDTARVSLAELASMQPGYAVELAVPLAQAQVRLVCQGRTLGRGQLIAIGDQLGVRITRLEFAHDAAAAR
jgi:type III secretion protein Q